MHSSVDLTTVQKLLLACGILAVLLKVLTEVLAGATWREYSFVSQSISELGAAGAPTRSLVLPLQLTFDVLMLAFAYGLWQVAEGSALMRIVSGLVAGNAVIDGLVILFLPMRIGPGTGSSASTVHVVLMAAGVLFFMLAIALAGAANNDWFRYLSFGILLAYIALAILRPMIPTPMVDGQPIATVGVQERTMAAGYLLWIAALAIHQIVGTRG